MPLYHCVCCDFATYIKTHYRTHLKTKKHIVNQEKHSVLSINNTKESNSNAVCIKSENKIYNCKYCNKRYKYSQGLSKHIKYTCKKSNDEDLKELARLLNETKEEMTEIIKSKDCQLDKMQRQIDKLKNKLQIKPIVNGDIINHNTIYNIQLLNYGSTDYSHLTEKDYINCINDCNRCVMTLIERVHFNTNKPENMNIYISSIKGNYIMVYKDNAWQIQNKKEQINDLYDYNEVILENWYDEYKEKHPDIIQSFQRYLKNRDDNSVINEVKHEILKMLYNNRRMVQE